MSVARDLAAKGANVIVVARSTDKLQKTVEKMHAAAKNPGQQRFHYITADVSVPDYATGLIEEATRWNHNQPLDIVWCLAGFSTPSLLLDMPMSELKRHMNVNFYGCAELSLAILRVWLAPEFPIEEQARHLILTASTAVCCVVPGFGPYTPTKFAVRGFADTIATELLLYPQNVKLHLLLPGSIATEGMDRENLTKPEITKILEETDPFETPDYVSKHAIRALERGEHFITTNWLTAVMKWSSMGTSYRNNWITDTLGIWLASLFWIFGRITLDGQIRGYAKKHGHPANYPKKTLA